MHGSSTCYSDAGSYFVLRTSSAAFVILEQMNGSKKKIEMKQKWLFFLFCFSRRFLPRWCPGVRWSLVFFLTLTSVAGQAGTNALQAQDFSDYEVIERSSKSPFSNRGSRIRSNSRQCFSCMSTWYGGLWEPVSYNLIYQRPGKGFGFTDHCRDPSMKPDDVAKVDCPKDNCVTITETLKIGYGDVGYIRGCYDSILKWGFNKTGYSGSLNYREFCRRFNLTDLAQGQSAKMHNTELLVCSCRGHLCNGAKPSTNSASSSWHYFFVSISAASLLLATAEWVPVILLLR